MNDTGRRFSRVLTLVVAVITSIAFSHRGSAQQSEETAPQDPMKILGVSEGLQESDAVPIPMRDGTRLSALVIRPRSSASEQKVPTILIKTPYIAASELSLPAFRGALTRLLQSGYALAVVNDRGTQWSEGEFHMQKGAGSDGYDVLSWIADQPWSNGKVGTLGCSSSAENQWALARLNHPAHKAMVVMSATAGMGVVAGLHDQGLFYTGGVPSLNFAWWYMTDGNQYHPKLPAELGQEERERLAASYSARSRRRFSEDNLFPLANHLPSKDILTAVNSPTTEFNLLITLTPSDKAWNEYDFLRDGDSTRVPGLHIDSWYAILHAYGTAKAFQYLSANSPNQHLVFGGTGHCDMATETVHTMVGDRDIGDARFDYDSLIVDWFNHWLKDEDNATNRLPLVQYYSLNSNKWTTSAEWPPTRVKTLKLFFRSGGYANSLFGDGHLDTEQPKSGERFDQYVYNPMHPVPTRGGGCCTSRVALDQSEVEARNDVLVYSTKPLEKDLDIAGYISATLFVSSSALDTDLMIKLVDVYPDGRAFNILDSAKRLRYRDGYDLPVFMTRGSVYKVILDEMVVASHFPAGHRIRLELASSNFPNDERNLNTGGKNFDESQPVVAINRIYHDSAHESFVTFPVVNASR